MTEREIALVALKVAETCGDTEVAHIDADKALCALLVSIGYQDVVDAFALVPKWYA